MHSDGSGLRPLTVPPSSGCGGPNDDPAAIGCLQPAWSPDGTKIAFAGGLDLETDGEIYVINVDGTGLTQITHTGGSQGTGLGRSPGRASSRLSVWARSRYAAAGTPLVPHPPPEKH